MNRIIVRMFILFFTAFSAVNAAGVPVSSWLDLSSSSLNYWHVRSENEDDSILDIKSSLKSYNYRKIMILFPKASSAYNTAMDTLLGFFREKQLNIHFRLINYRGNFSKGMDAVSLAEKSGYNMIFSMGSQSTKFIFENYSGGKIPVVTVCSKDPVLLGQAENYTGGSGNNIAYTSLDASMSLQLNYIKRLRKNLKNIAVLYAADNISAVKTQVNPMVSEAAEEGIKVFHIKIENQNYARIELEKKIPLSLGLMRETDPGLKDSIFWITGSTSVFQEIAAINTYSEGVPVLSVVPDLVNGGENSAVLSIGVSFENNALIAALYAFEILENKKNPGNFPVGLISPPDIAVNFGKARQIGLKIPFSFFESAGTIYNYEGRAVRKKGRRTITD